MVYPLLPMFDPYTLAACLAGVYCVSKGVDLKGSIFVALIWPVLIAMAVYFGIKLRVLKRPFRRDWVLDVELLLCIGVAGAGVLIYVLPAYS